MSNFSTLFEDAVTAWANDQLDPLANRLSLFALKATEQCMIPFTTHIVPFGLHYSEVHGCYLHCNGVQCLFCQLNVKLTEHDLLPMYDTKKQVRLLSVDRNPRITALRPQLLPILRNLKTAERVVVGIRRLDSVIYEVKTYPLLPEVDDGATVIRDFTDRFNSGSIELGSVYPRQSNESLAADPEVARQMALRGIKLS